jgi:predicted DNA-binding protein YlxM (UPF0122 family)
MGMDVYSDNAVLVTIGELWELVTNSDQEKTLHDTILKLLETYRQNAQEEINENVEPLKKYEEDLKVYNATKSENEKLWEVYHALTPEQQEEAEQPKYLHQPYPPSSWRQNYHAAFSKAVDKYLNDEKLGDIGDRMVELFDYILGDEDETLSRGPVAEIWSMYLKDVYPAIPELYEDVEYFYQGGRMDGWDVPQEVPLFRFDTSACYEEVLTESGKKLNELLNGMTKYDWTIMSV